MHAVAPPSDSDSGQLGPFGLFHRLRPGLGDDDPKLPPSRGELSSARSGRGDQKRRGLPAGRSAADAAVSDWEDMGVRIGEHRRVSTGRTAGASPNPGPAPRRRRRRRSAAKSPSPDGAVVVLVAAAAICRHPAPAAIAASRI